MIPATKLHQTFRLDINRINSDYLKSISVSDVDTYLTNSYYTIYENLVQKAESNSLIEDQIKQKLVRNKSLNVITDKEYSKVIYPKEVFRVIRKRAIVCREGCKSKTISLHPVQSSDLSESLSSDYWKPSFEWGESLYIQDSNGLLVYHNCDFEIKNIIIDYYTKPKPIRCPSLIKDDCYKSYSGEYIDDEGNAVTVDSNFELDSTDLWLKVSHLAASAALRNTGDLQDYKAALESVITNEKIFL